MCQSTFTVDKKEKKKIKTKRAPEIGAFEVLTRGSAPTRRARWPMLPPTTAFQVSATLRAAPPRPRPSCMCVRSMSVGCVSSVAHTAATVPDARLVIVFEVPRCIEDRVYQHSFLHLISRPLGRWQELGRLQNRHLVLWAHLLQVFLEAGVEQIVEG
jgi:hypothetical protein